MIANKTIMVIAIILGQCMLGTYAQNESFPWVTELNGIKSAAIINQRVYLNSISQNSQATFYQLTIMQEGVQDSINMRAAIQWLRNCSDVNCTTADYRGVVFQVGTTSTTINPVITWATANDYHSYNQTGGKLNHTNYLDAILLGQAGFTSNSGSSAVNNGNFVTDVRGETIRTNNGIEVNINFTVQELDPIGESRLWYKWIFYRNIADNIVIEGNSEPYFYSTYTIISDFFNTEGFMNIFYIMYALSMFWWFGLPFMLGFATYLQVDYVIQAINSAQTFNQWPGSERYQFQLIIGLFLGWFEIWVAIHIMNICTLFPFISPVVNFFVVLYMYINYMYYNETDDKRLYYGKESDSWGPYPQVISNESFRDIHFPNGRWAYDYTNAGDNGVQNSGYFPPGGEQNVENQSFNQ